MSDRERRIAIIGAGITGLTAAYRLEAWARDHRVAVSVFEAKGRPGGIIRTTRMAGVVVEGGADSFLTRKPEALQLAYELGLGGDVIGSNPKARGAYIFHRRKFHPIPRGIVYGVPTDLDALRKSGILTSWGKWRVLGDLVLPGQAIDGDIALGQLLRHRFGNQWVDRLAAPILSGIYGGDVDHLSLEAIAPAVAGWLRRQKSLIRAAQKSVAEESLKRATAHFSVGPDSMFATLAQGLSTLVEALAARLQWTRLRYQTAVTRIEPVPGGRFRLFTNSGDEIADAVIVTVPAHAAASLLSFAPVVAEHLGRIPYADVAVVGAVYRPQAITLRMDRTGFLVPGGQGVQLTAATWVRAKWAYRNDTPYVPLRTFYGRAGQPSVLHRSDAEILDWHHEDLKATMGIDADPIEAAVFRIPQGMPQYLVGHRDRVNQITQRLNAWHGLILAGAAYDGVGIPDCIRQGTSAAQRVMALEGLTRSEGMGRG